MKEALLLARIAEQNAYLEALKTEVAAMQAENAVNMLIHEENLYGEDEFARCAKEMRAVAAKIRDAMAIAARP